MRPSVAEPSAARGMQDRRGEHFPRVSSNGAYSPRMSYPASPSAQPQPKLRQRIALAPAEGWLVMALLAVAVYCVAYSMIAANYEGGSMFILPWSAFAGLLVGLAVAKIQQLPQVIMHLAACLLGYWLAVFLTSMVALHIPWLELLSSIRATVMSGGLTSAQGSADMVFLFYLTFLCFFLGYFGAWLVYRAHLPWLVAFVYSSILFVNLDNVTKQDMPLLILVMAGALLLLVARVHLSAQLAQWQSEGLHTDRAWLRGITMRSMQIASLLAVGVLLVGWLIPDIGQPAMGATAWNTLSNIVNNVTQGHISLQNPGSILSQYQPSANFFGDQLSIAGSVHLPTGEVLYYTSASGPQYLEGFTYDHFDGHTWTSQVSTTPETFDSEQPLPTDAALQNSVQTTTSITIVVPPESTKNYIFGPPQPTTFDVATSIYGSGITSAWTQQSQLVANEHYQVVSTLPTFAPSDLEAIPNERDNAVYWQQDPNYLMLNAFYLQLPTDLSPKVGQTLRQWTQGTTNPYDALRQLEAHLSDQTVFTYSVDNPSVPSNVDAVDWLLQTRKGYCTYYASAMVVMARMMGIPTRMVNGFSHGHFDQQHNIWVVDGSDAHSWVQSYFPGYGWINFDPTPGYSSNNTSPSSQPTPPPAPAPSPVHPKPTAPVAKKGTTSVHPPTSTTGNIGGTPNGGAGQTLLIVLTLGALVLSFIILLLALWMRWWRNLYPESTFISGMYWRVCRVAGWVGLAPRQSQTPYEYSGMLSLHVPRHAGPLQRLTDLYVRERYAGRYGLPPHVLNEMGEQVQPALRKTLTSLLLARLRKR